MPDTPVTRREVDQLIERASSAAAARDVTSAQETERAEAIAAERWEEHRRMHEAEGETIRLALSHEAEREATHRMSHDSEHVAHAEKHAAESLAVRTALDAVNRERVIHAEAHDREHLGHQREHTAGQLAIDKAEIATDKRFYSVNATREQMTDILRTLASKDSVDGLTLDQARRWDEIRKDLDRRFGEAEKSRAAINETLRTSIVNLEKGDVKAEGRGIGQGTVLTVIVGAIGFALTFLTLVIVIANLLTKQPIS